MSVNPNEPAVNPTSGGSTPLDDPSKHALFQKAGGDWGKANESYFNVVKELGNTKNEIRSYAERLSTMESNFNSVFNRSAGAPDDPFEALQSETGLPAESLRRAVDAAADKKIESKLAEFFTPILSQMTAEETLASEIDNFDELKGETRKFLKTNPEVNEVFESVRKSDPTSAWKYAMREMVIAQNAGSNTTRPVPMPGGSTPQGRMPEGSGKEQDNSAKEREALDYFAQYGDSGPYRTLRFKGTSVERAIQDGMRQAGYAPQGS